jgi:hypothetical protein
MTGIHSRRLERELLARHLVPDGCRFLSLVIEANRPIVITLQKYPTEQEMRELGDALKAAALEEGEVS